MSVLSHIITVLNIAKEIKETIEDVKNFKAKSETLAKNVEIIVPPVEALKKKCTEEELDLERYRDSSGAGSGDGADINLDENGVRIWISSLCELQCCMTEIKSFLKKLSSQNWFQRILRKRKIKDKFESFENNLVVLALSLTLSLQVDFKELITEEMVKKLKDSLCTINIIAKDVAEIRQDLENQGNVGAETNNLVKELHFRQQLTVPTENEGHIKYADFTEVVKHHEGTYGTIYMAKHNCEDKTLVVKKFEDRGLSALKELKEQCALWKNLNFSRFIVHLYGYVIDEAGHMCFVVEYMPKGTLRSVLLGSQQLPWEKRMVIARDCAQGLCAIHRGQGKTMLHRAITSTRFMVDENDRAKISDNGFVKSASKISKSTTASSSEGCGSAESDEKNYLCPEETRSDGRKHTVKGEIYKLGVIFYEIASRKKPFQAMEKEGGKPLKDLVKWKFIQDGKTEPPPADTPEDFKDLIDACRREDPSERPSTYDVVRRLEKMCFPELETPVEA